MNTTDEEQGIVLRAMHHIFAGIERRKQEAISAGHSPPEFSISTQFLKLYNEEILDLIDSAREARHEATNQASRYMRMHPEGCTPLGS